MSFVQLHVHSEYSLLEASCKVKAIAKKAHQYGMPAVALTDNGNMFGAIEFYFAAKDLGLNPIVGCDFYLAPKSRKEKSMDREQVQRPLRRLVLLAQNFKGYQNLCQLSSIGFQQGFYYKPRIDYEVLREFNQDLLCLSGGLYGDVAQTLLWFGEEAALEKIRELQSLFGDRFYLETNRTGLKQWNQINPFLEEASKITGVPLVAANDVHYITRDDQMAQEVLICIGTNKTLNDETRFRLGSDQFYFKSPEEMKYLFSDMPDVCDRSLEVASRCQLQFKLKDAQGKTVYHLPSFPTRDGVSLQEEIRLRSYEGLDVRLLEAKNHGEAVADEKIPDYHARLDYELGIINKMGFNGYFLIVQDFINWAKTHDIPVGPGRGSGAGSLVAFCLRITDLDPIPHKLLFERFLNPERISMPDFDIDFCQDRRGEVIQYVVNKYGVGSVSQIITYGKLQARAAIKDVGRVLGMTFSEVDIVSKLMPDKLGITLKEAIEVEPRMRELMETNPLVGTLMELAQRVEGLVRHAGIHAAGVVIADGNLVSHAPLYRGANDENVVQYDMKHAEKIGLIKFDFLGLKTLTHINNAIKLIEKNRKIKIASQDIPVNDVGIYEIMSKGDTAGIFQFEGDGISDAIRQIKPTCFGDITAINALYRPGPMDMIPEFAKRKNGESPVEYLFEELKPSLEETYGIIVYQEQVMAIASTIAGYSLGEADMLRRAMGKKIKAEMDEHRVRFLKGAGEKGFDPKKSDELFDLMYKFADYGFNKSHAAAYCVVAAQTAWLKCYYTAEFFAALLSTEMSDTDKVVKYVKDVQRHGIKVQPPHVNYSDYYFTVHGETVYFSLGAIKGVGQSAVEAIVEAREQLPDKKFESLEQFFEKVDLRRVNKKVIECLIKAGALDHFGSHRAQLFQGYPKILDGVEVKRKDTEIGQRSLFDLIEDTSSKKIELEKVRPWSRMASLTFEKEVLGFYLSDHPLIGWDHITSMWTTCEIKNLKDLDTKAEPQPAPPPGRRTRDFGKKRVLLDGLVSQFRELITKKGTRMAFAALEDLTGSVELVVFPDVYAKTEMYFKEEKPLLIGGLLEIENGNPKVIVDSVISVEESLKKVKHLAFNIYGFKEDELVKLQSLFKEYPGSTEVSLLLDMVDAQKRVVLACKTEPIKIQFSNDFLEGIQQHLGRTDFMELRT